MSPPEVPGPAGRSFKVWREGFWRRILATSSNPSRKLRYKAVTFGLVAVIGVADYLTGFELSLLVFYFLPVCMAVAAVGWQFGTVTAVLSVATWMVGDFAAGARFANTFVPVWNALIALGTYMVVVWLLTSLIALHREMEERVRQRTAALNEEIAERVRLEKVVLEISERERRAIGRDLHDGLSQHLTGTALVAQALGARLAARSAAEAPEVHKIVALIEQGIEQTRSLAKGLLLAEIERDGLVTALEDLAATVRAQHGIECDFSCKAAVNLGESGTATHIYRIAEEATRNAIRHGRARRVMLTLSTDAGALVITVRDDGAGIPPQGAESRASAFGSWRTGPRSSGPLSRSTRRRRGAPRLNAACLMAHPTMHDDNPIAPQATPRRRIFLVDDHPLVREGLAKLIDQEADLCVWAEADEAADAYAGIVRTKPDAVIVDLSLQGDSGLELIKRVQALARPPPILVLSMHDEAVYAERSLRAGALGYVMKRETSGKVVAALRKILCGQLYVSPAIAARAAEKFLRTRAVAASSPVESLTDRELEVFRRIGQGQENRRIAEDLHLSLKTVQTHCAHIKEKLGLQNATALMLEAVRWVESQP